MQEKDRQKYRRWLKRNSLNVPAAAADMEAWLNKQSRNEKGYRAWLQLIEARKRVQARKRQMRFRGREGEKIMKMMEMLKSG